MCETLVIKSEMTNKKIILTIFASLVPETTEGLVQHAVWH